MEFSGTYYYICIGENVVHRGVIDIVDYYNLHRVLFSVSKSEIIYAEAISSIGRDGRAEDKMIADLTIELAEKYEVPCPFQYPETDFEIKWRVAREKTLKYIWEKQPKGHA